jgi:hypothetical protein
MYLPKGVRISVIKVNADGLEMFNSLKQLPTEKKGDGYISNLVTIPIILDIKQNNFLSVEYEIIE